MNSDYTARSYAKINLTLEVLRKREDEFHDIRSLIAPINLADTLTFSRANSYSLQCDDSTIPLDDNNLISKAVSLFQKHTGANCFWSVFLDKKIPHAAGLGGGSSNAATTLLALNKIEQTNLSNETLRQLAAKIGSDVPFFINTKASWCLGRGEIIEPLSEPLPELSILLIKPLFGVSTPDAYQRWENAKPLPGISYEPQRFNWGSLHNDLELSVFTKHRFLAEIKNWLLKKSHVKGALMSGSGSTLFALIDPDRAEKVAQEIKTDLDPTLWVSIQRVLSKTS